MAKPLQVTPIFAPTNYVESELDRDDAGTGQNTPDLPSSTPVQYIESSNLFQSAPLLDLGTKVKPEFNLDITGIHQDASSLAFSRPVYTTSPEGFEMAAWPYSPYCPIEDAYCCTGDYAPETNDFLEGCSPWKASEVTRKARRAKCPDAQEYCCADFLPDRKQGFHCVQGHTPWLPGQG